MEGLALNFAPLDLACKDEKHGKSEMAPMYSAMQLWTVEYFKGTVITEMFNVYENGFMEISRITVLLKFIKFLNRSSMHNSFP